jgi:hypothetical protein
MASLDISKAYDMCWRYNILKKKIKDWKIDGKLLHFINEIAKNRTLRVAIGNTLSEEKKNRKRSRPGSGIEEPINNIGYAVDWIIHTTYKHERASVVKLQKAID